jgi:hypothetical protein
LEEAGIRGHLFEKTFILKQYRHIVTLESGSQKMVNSIRQDNTFPNKHERLLFHCDTYTLKRPPVLVMLKPYEIFMVPIMWCGCEIWGFEEDKDIEKVELWILINVLVSTPTMAVRGKLGQLPLHLWCKERLLKYWDFVQRTSHFY